MKIHWTHEARERLRDIESYIADDSPWRAKQVVERIAKRSRQLSEYPESGRYVPEFPEDNLRELLERPFRIIYRIKDDRIEILTVLHYRRVLRKDDQWRR